MLKALIFGNSCFQKNRSVIQNEAPILGPENGPILRTTRIVYSENGNQKTVSILEPLFEKFSTFARAFFFFSRSLFGDPFWSQWVWMLGSVLVVNDM